jgi:hypothetical protein
VHSRLSKSNPFNNDYIFLGLSSDGKMDRHTWKAIQMIMSDSQKFSDALHGVSWQEGLYEDIVRSVEPFFAKNELGELGQPLQENTGKAGTPPGKVSPTTGKIVGNENRLWVYFRDYRG